MTFISASVVTLALTLTATAQQYSPTTLYSFTPAARSLDLIGVTGATNIPLANAVFNVSDYSEIAVQCIINWSNTATDNVLQNALVSFGASVDGVTYHTNYFQMSCVGKSNVLYTAASVTTCTNWNVGAFGYLKLNSISNLAGGVTFITNAVVKVSVKPGRREYR